MSSIFIHYDKYEYYTAELAKTVDLSFNNIDHSEARPEITLIRSLFFDRKHQAHACDWRN
jgi:hypothetical protein